ncbi:tyrosine-type recombinase/integrase [Streptomyces celluloflavus]|uniref:tyrosine-type recombinase/integrase n=1 Tax=Streptomyces celluloflavus TaxID=58344 RepID=UPI0036BB0009
MTAAVSLPAAPPAPGASEKEKVAFLWSLIEPAFFKEVGWDSDRRVLAAPVDHPMLGMRACPVPGCDLPSKARGLCRTCQDQHRKSGLPLKEFITLPRTAPRAVPGQCRVDGCERTWINSRKQPLCRSHWYQYQQFGCTLTEFLADPAARALPGFGDCGVLACTRQAVTAVGHRLCHPHGKQLNSLRKEGPVDEQLWLRTAPSGCNGAEISFRGLPDLVVAQLLFGLQYRCQRGAKTDVGGVRSLIDRTIRPSQVGRLEDVPRPESNGTAVILLNRLTAYALRAFKTPEGEYGKDTWDLAVFGHRGSVEFTAIRQPWLREAAKRWARDYLTRTRSRSTSSHARQHLTGLAFLSRSLHARPDHGTDTTALGRADIENYLNRMTFLEANGRIAATTRISYVRATRNVLRQSRVMGLTRADGPMARLPDDFVITRHDVPKMPEPSEEGQDLPPEVMRQLCAHLDLFEEMTCREIRVAQELMMDTGRRPEEICKLEYHCLNRDRQGKPVLVYNNWKEQRIRRELPVHEPTAQLVREQQERVRLLYPDRPLSELALLPSSVMNQLGNKGIDATHFSGIHREWITALPEFHLDDGTVFDKEKIFPYAYRHSFAQRHADAGISIEVLSPLMDHDSYQSTRCYYRVKEVRLREAVDKVTAMQFDRHGQRVWGAVTTLLDAERTRLAIGSVQVPFGTCSEPSNVAAGGGACPLRFRCVGCDHFSTDVSYLPELGAYLDGLLRQREKLRSMTEADDWARAEAAPSDEEIARIRRLIRRVTEEVDQLTDAERAEIQQAAAMVRKTRQGFLGMPRIPQPLPDLRPERPA